MLVRALILVMCLAATAAADDWQPIEQGYVRVAMPGAPTHTTSAIDDTPTELFVWKDARVTLQLQIAYGFFAGRDIEKTLGNAALYGDAHPVSTTPFTDVHLASGRELVFRGAIKRLGVYEGALYVLTAAFAGPVDRGVADKFFGSLAWGPWSGAGTWMSWETQQCQCKYGMPSAGEKRSMKTSGGHTQNLWVLSRDAGDRFVFSASLGTAKDAPADAMVDAAIDATLKGKRGDKKAIKIGAHPGREALVVADGVKTFTRMYVANGNLYALVYVAPETAVDAAARDYFFAMFQPLLAAR